MIRKKSTWNFTPVPMSRNKTNGAQIIVTCCPPNKSFNWMSIPLCLLQCNVPCHITIKPCVEIRHKHAFVKGKFVKCSSHHILFDYIFALNMCKRQTGASEQRECYMFGFRLTIKNKKKEEEKKIRGNAVPGMLKMDFHYSYQFN